MYIYVYIYIYIYTRTYTPIHTHERAFMAYHVATISRLFKMIGLFGRKQSL